MLRSAQPLSPNGVKTLSPPGAIKPTGTWSLGTRAGDFVFMAGMRGIDPATNQLVQGDEARIRQGFLNMKLIAESEGATLRDATRLVVYVTDMFRFRPLGEQGAGGALGAGALPAAHDHRGRTGSTRTTFSRSKALSTPRSKSEGSGPWAGGPTCATYMSTSA